VRVLLAVVVAATVSAGESQRPRWKKTWIVSAAVMTAASLLDAHSSRGLPETNPFLRNGQGQFSATKGYALKSGATLGIAFLQALVVRKRPELYKPCVMLNFSATGAFAAAAWRNHAVADRREGLSYRNLLGVGGGGQQSRAE
jgi:hypothetical protein